MDAQLLDQAQAWLNQDPDEITRAELKALIESGDAAGLADRFGGRIGFGTAGLRGELGAGPNRMNRVLVAQAAAGIANWLLTKPEFTSRGKRPSVIIGFDGRINSDVFAQDSAQIFAGAGIDVLLFDAYVPTPMLAFAVKQGGYCMGVMVTASHNPPRDNGYKVYLGGSNGGSQIISPVDSQIAAQIDAVAASRTFEQLPKSLDFETGGGALRAWYIAHTAGLVAPQPSRQIKIVFTAMHGVGWATARSVFEAAGLHDPILVTQQIEPDGSFPTVAFPNPEEPGALDLAVETANVAKADLILACDPDADRLAVAVPDPTHAGGWRKLTGDQVGLILGAELAAKAQRAGVAGNLGSSIVSSSQLDSVAKHYGLGYVPTLTGFKWISKVPNLLFGFEEALGYCVDASHTPDKDGISAALLVADLANRLLATGSNLDRHLSELGNLFGHYATGQISLRFASVSVAQELVAKLRQAPPVSIDGQAAKFTDLSVGSADLPATDGLRFDLPDGRRVIIRPSGTEPKLKCYLQAVGADSSDALAKLAALNASMRELLG
jgi:phosphomannomutase